MLQDEGGGGPYRVGRTLGRTIYRQNGPKPAKGDEFIGLVETQAWAELIVRLLNDHLT